MGKNLLVINDLPGYGKVALSVMQPILSQMGHCVYNLPTALVSNTLDYGDFAIYDTTQYMRETMEVWSRLGFRFDCISTGFLVSSEQTELIEDFLIRHKRARPETLVVVDPILGDDGRLYNGVGEETVAYMRRLADRADVMVPNFTEAALLLGRPATGTVTVREAEEMAAALCAGGAGAAVITSLEETGTGRHFVLGWSREGTFLLPFAYLPVRFPGTGDIFSAVMTGRLLQGWPLRESVADAMRVVETLLRANAGSPDTYKGIPVEAYLHDVLGEAQ